MDITPEWLATLGFTGDQFKMSIEFKATPPMVGSRSSWFYITFEGPEPRASLWEERDAASMARPASVTLPPVSTRDDVLRWLEMLGVQND